MGGQKFGHRKGYPWHEIVMYVAEKMERLMELNYTTGVIIWQLHISQIMMALDCLTQDVSCDGRMKVLDRPHPKWGLARLI